MEAKKNIGVVLVALGFVLLFTGHKLLELGWIGFWPLFILSPGLLFFLDYFNESRRQKNPAEKKELLIPGGFFTGTGLFLLAFSLEYLPWSYLGGLWPVFLLLLGLSFCLAFFADRQDQGLLIPGGFLSLTGVIAVAIYLIRSRYGLLFLCTFLAVAIGAGFYCLWRKNQEAGEE